MAIFTTLHGITGRDDRRYPCAATRTTPDGGQELWAGADAEARFDGAFGGAISVRDNDGVVPLRSQVWGTVVWAGLADHLDVLGHFHGDERGPAEVRHRDWLTSGSAFDQQQFDALMSALAKGMLST
jgi:triacylglycerol lipase